MDEKYDVKLPEPILKVNKQKLTQNFWRFPTATWKHCFSDRRYY